MKNEKWGPGPWDDEPDREEWRVNGLACLALRHERYGHWCGYVAVPPGHPLHGKRCEDATVAVHGGITYASKCNEHVCHKPLPGEPDDVWWLGFDCAHGFDVSPGLRMPSSSRDTYRTLRYVEEECASLALQIKARA